MPIVWHRLLKPRAGAISLLESLPPDPKGFIICRVNEDGQRLFAYFPTIIDVAKMIMNTSPSHHAFHEGILDKRAQRVRFDIDLSPEKLEAGQTLQSYGQQLLEQLLARLRETARELFSLELSYEEDLIITTSHGPDKFSVHVIVETLALANARQVRHFAGLVVNHPIFEGALKNHIIDMGIYKTTQFFRLLGSRRQVGEKRLKLLSPLTPRDFTRPARNDRDQLLLIVEALQATMITAVNMLRIFTVDLPEEVEYVARELTDPEEQAMQAAVDDYYPGVYKHIGYARNGGLSYKREQSSMCYACNVVHDSVGLLVVLLGRKIVSYCSRSNGVGVLIGTLPRPSITKLLPDVTNPELSTVNIQDTNLFASSDESISRSARSEEVWLYG